MRIEDVQLNWVHSPIPANGDRFFALTPFGSVWVAHGEDGAWEIRFPYDWDERGSAPYEDVVYTGEKGAKDEALRLYRERIDKAFAHA